ncbi:hypothetical protein SBRCBS47491_004513 [Sporothrix bragantina]|uniref:Ig-like domain-containing protein n=1 Tax=Sporothrix bragantina TaxID=671064 RepID=A0ABP0BPL5_9PEZI
MKFSSGSGLLAICLSIDAAAATACKLSKTSSSVAPVPTCGFNVFTNGDFSDGTTGWGASVDGALTASTDCAELNSATCGQMYGQDSNAYFNIAQHITTIPGKTYSGSMVYDIQVSGNDNGSLECYIKETGSQYYLTAWVLNNLSINTRSTMDLQFTATASSYIFVCSEVGGVHVLVTGFTLSC